MVLAHKYLSLFDKKVFELVTVKPPFKNYNPLPNEACFLYMIHGGNDSYSEEAHIKLTTREAVLMKCGNYIYDTIPDANTGEATLLAIHFHPDVLKKIYEKDLPKFLKKNQDYFHKRNMTKIGDQAIISNYVQSLMTLISHPEFTSEELIKLKMREVILLLLSTENASAVFNIINNLFSPKTFTLKEVVESHIFSAIGISDLANLTNFSLTSFKREFRKIYNDSPANYIKNRRLEKASELLLATDLPISTIAYDCQFNDLAHFSSSFKSKFECSPTEYRTNNSKK